MVQAAQGAGGGGCLRRSLCRRRATKVLRLAQEHEESAGKDPMGLAAAALYLSCVKNGEDITQRDIAEAANVTEVTIRNRYKGLKIDQNMDM